MDCWNTEKVNWVFFLPVITSSILPETNIICINSISIKKKNKWGKNKICAFGGRKNKKAAFRAAAFCHAGHAPTPRGAFHILFNVSSASPLTGGSAKLHYRKLHIKEMDNISSKPILGYYHCFG